jgi:hypothetical protein
MNRKIILFVISGLLAVGWAGWTYAPEMMNPRPTVLGLDVVNHPAVPIVRRVEMNGFIYSRIRASDIRESGGIPYLSRWDNNLEFSLYWVEMFNEQAWHATFTVPVEQLSTYGEEGRVAQIDIEIASGGDVSIETSNVERLRLIGLGRTSEVTDAMREPIILKQFCATRLADDDPARLTLIAGFEEWSVTGAKNGHANWMRRNENALPPSRCTPDWTLENE